MPIDWDAAATAAVTAVLVTGLVECFASPRLAARKERHLEALRTRRELATVIATLTMAARMSVTDLPAGADDDLRERWDEEQRRHHARLHGLVTDLFDDLGRYVAAYPEAVGVDLIRAVVGLHGVMLSSRPERRRAENGHAVGRAMTRVVGGASDRTAARADLRAVIARTGAANG